LIEREGSLDEDWKYTFQKTPELTETEAIWLFAFGKSPIQSVEEIAKI